MTQSETSLLTGVDELLADARAGVLATVGPDGRPAMRWMAPSTMKGRPGTLYAVTSAKSAKVQQIRANPQVQWMIQSRNLDRVITLKGKINIVESASLNMEVFEEMGERLRMAWRLNVKPEEAVVLETVLEEGTYFEPMKNIRETVTFHPVEGGQS
jgi:general stress protein 26